MAPIQCNDGQYSLTGSTTCTSCLAGYQCVIYTFNMEYIVTVDEIDPGVPGGLGPAGASLFQLYN